MVATANPRNPARRGGPGEQRPAGNDQWRLVHERRSGVPLPLHRGPVHLGLQVTTQSPKTIFSPFSQKTGGHCGQMRPPENRLANRPIWTQSRARVAGKAAGFRWSGYREDRLQRQGTEAKREKSGLYLEHESKLWYFGKVCVRFVGVILWL